MYLKYRFSIWSISFKILCKNWDHWLVIAYLGRVRWPSYQKSKRLVIAYLGRVRWPSYKKSKRLFIAYLGRVRWPSYQKSICQQFPSSLQFPVWELKLIKNIPPNYGSNKMVFSGIISVLISKSFSATILCNQYIYVECCVLGKHEIVICSLSEKLHSKYCHSTALYCMNPWAQCLQGSFWKIILVLKLITNKIKGSWKAMNEKLDIFL